MLRRVLKHRHLLAGCSRQFGFGSSRHHHDFPRLDLVLRLKVRDQVILHAGHPWFSTDYRYQGDPGGS